VNPLALELNNVGPYVGRHTIDLPLGLVAILGSNGSGKSTLVNCVDWALFGAEGRGGWAPYVSPDADDFELTLVFEHDGERYRVRRGWSARGRGKATCDLERWEDTA
jgi:exonuclease SbcC